MLVNLNDLLPKAAISDYAVPCFNVLGFEDAKAIVNAAEKVNKPIILAANKSLIDFMGVKHAALFMCALAKEAAVPVCVHLDHTYDESIIYQAIQYGFSSVMFDGSQLPLEENIRRTRAVVDVAHAVGVSVEGEIGSVPYDDIRPHILSIPTRVEDAQRFAEHSGADAIAVSVGNIHRLKTPTAIIDHHQLAAIAKVVDAPLVIHGTSGINDSDLQRLIKSAVAKFNIGTLLRQAFIKGVRQAVEENHDIREKALLMEGAMSAVEQLVARQLTLFYDLHRYTE